jgi:hypothetical protein
MKKITLQNYMTDKYYPKIVKAVDNELKSQNFVAHPGICLNGIT